MTPPVGWAGAVSNPHPLPQAPKGLSVNVFTLPQSLPRVPVGVVERQLLRGEIRTADVGLGASRACRTHKVRSFPARDCPVAPRVSPVPLIADTYGGTRRKCGCRLDGAHREFARKRRPAPYAAKQSSTTQKRRSRPLEMSPAATAPQTDAISSGPRFTNPWVCSRSDTQKAPARGVDPM